MLINDYIKILYKYPQKIIYGFFHTFLSAFGDTFIISIFIPYICFNDIDNLQCKYIYSIATLTAALSAFYICRLVDSTKIKFYSTISLLILSISYIFLRFSINYYIIFALFYLIRISGHALLSHVTDIYIVNNFPTNLKGKSFGFCNLGFSLSQSILPITITQLLHYTNWHNVTMIIGISMILCLIVLNKMLRSTDTNSINLENIENTSIKSKESPYLKSFYFWSVIAIYITLPLLLSGIMINRVFIIKLFNITDTIFSSFFAILAFSRIIALLSSGTFIDKFSAKNIVYFYSSFICLSIIGLFINNIYGLTLFFISIGVGLGLMANLKSSLWVEVYGIKHVNNIRAIIGPMSLIAASIGPSLISFLISKNLFFNSISTILLIVLTLTISNIINFNRKNATI